MTRGKYAAQAANRLAALDNELLAEKTTEVTQLQQQITQLRAELAAERAERGALVVARADELAAEQIKQIRDTAAATEAQHQEQKRVIAQWLTRYWGDLQRNNPNIDCIPLHYENLLAYLVGSDNVGEYIAAFMAPFNAKFGTRRYRRMTAQGKRKAVNEIVQHAAFNGMTPADVKFQDGGGSEAFLDAHGLPITGPKAAFLPALEDLGLVGDVEEA